MILALYNLKPRSPQDRFQMRANESGNINIRSILIIILPREDEASINSYLDELIINANPVRPN